MMCWDLRHTRHHRRHHHHRRISQARADGLGDIAISHSNQRFDTPVMAVVVTLLIAQLWLFQFAGDTALATL